MVVLFALEYLAVFITNTVATNFYFILPYYPLPLSVHMRQDERQAMTFIEVLRVHVDPHINKHSKNESERKRKNKATRKIVRQCKANRIHIISVYQEGISHPLNFFIEKFNTFSSLYCTEIATYQIIVNTLLTTQIFSEKSIMFPKILTTTLYNENFLFSYESTRSFSVINYGYFLFHFYRTLTTI